MTDAPADYVLIIAIGTIALFGLWLEGRTSND